MKNSPYAALKNKRSVRIPTPLAGRKRKTPSASRYDGLKERKGK